jgi:hypothetical protein
VLDARFLKDLAFGLEAVFCVELLQVRLGMHFARAKTTLDGDLNHEIRQRVAESMASILLPYGYPLELGDSINEPDSSGCHRFAIHLPKYMHAGTIVFVMLDSIGYQLSLTEHNGPNGESSDQIVESGRHAE